MATEKVTTTPIITNKANERVPYTIPLTRGMSDAPIFVSVNGNTFYIKPGENVQLPRYVVDFLEAKSKRDVELMRMEMDREKSAELGSVRRK